ncbi:MAG: OsmC family protein [Nonlabens sp.]|uniref:OsmC family protein n=1 Tax=Nonlabens sp. TaxID=1888209 RepID=UPI003EF60756
MKKEFRFEVQTQWQQGQFENPKTHVSIIDGKQEIIVSAAREFKGEATAYNPEDLLLSALSSCHMMSYFYVCQQHGVKIIEYKDCAIGTLELRSDMSGGFSKVVLNPVVTLKDPSQELLAMSLHEQAHKLCFIANSVKFDIDIQSVINFI